MVVDHDECNRELATRNMNCSEIPRRMLRLGLCVVLALWLAPALGGLPVVLPVQAATLTVCPSGPPTCQYAHIQDAINAAASGDTISIAVGTYDEHLDIEKNLTLLGAGTNATIVDGSSSGTVVSIGISNTATVVTLLGMTIEHGQGAAAGGINNAGALALTNSTVVSNSVGDYSGPGDSAGGIDNIGTLTLTNSTVSGNSAGGCCTGISGGGIYNSGTTALANSIVAGNNGGSGAGGISNSNSSTLTLTNSTVSGNSGGGAGGGIFSYGTLTLTDSTVSGNSAGCAGCSGGGGGGGIENYGTLTLTNSTVSGNNIRGYFSGGGIDNVGTLTLTDSTVSGNSASKGGGIDNSGTFGPSPVTLTNSILAGNTGVSGPDCSGKLTSSGYSLLGIGDGCSGLTNGVNGDQVGTSSQPLDALLDPLQNYGGPTLTMAPQPSSPAIDAVPASHCALSTDQRGQPRPDEAADNGTCNIGAVEGAGPAPTLSLNPTALDFGDQTVYLYGVTKTVTLANTSALPLHVSSVGLSGPNANDFNEADTCSGVTLAGNATCTIDVSFGPLGRGNRAASVVITDTATNTPQIVPLTGHGVYPIATISPSPLSFGTVLITGTGTSASVTIANNGTVPLALFAAKISGPNTQDFYFDQTSPCFSNPLIPPGGSCTVNIIYQPAAIGTSNATLYIADNAADSPQTVSLSGIAATSLPATATNTPTTTPTTTATPSATAQPLTHTPTPTATPTGTALPTATQPPPPPTVSPMPTAGLCSSHPAAPALTVGLSPHSAFASIASLPLTLRRMPPYVTGGGLLSLTIHTAPHAKVNASLDVVTMQVVTHGHGAHRTRTLRRVTLYHIALQGTSDAHGRYSSQLHVAYQPTTAVVATLTVRAQATCSSVSQRTSLTILPLRIMVTPQRLVAGGMLAITLHTGARGQVGITLEVDTTKDAVAGAGKHRRHIRRVVVLYRLRVQGAADAHGRFSRRISIAYRPSKPVLVSISVAVRLPQGTATGQATAMLLPRRH